MSEFVWTDALVVDYAGNWYPKHTEMFKCSKQPKPEWEIIEFFRQGCFKAALMTNWNYSKPHYQDATGTYSLDWLLSDNNSKIHSVKRIIDGEVFTVGDAVEIEGAKHMRPIYRFSIDLGTMMVHLQQYATVSFNMIIKPIPLVVPISLTQSQYEKLIKLLNE